MSGAMRRTEKEIEQEGRRVLRVKLSKGALAKETNFTTVQGPADRWYVEEVDLSSTAALCNRG